MQCKSLALVKKHVACHNKGNCAVNIGVRVELHLNSSTSGFQVLSTLKVPGICTGHCTESHCDVESDVKEGWPVRVARHLQPLHRREPAVRVSSQLRTRTAAAASCSEMRGTRNSQAGEAD
jgi:hypothetical protein